jgi:hypothetical protein
MFFIVIEPQRRRVIRDQGSVGSKQKAVSRRQKAVVNNLELTADN